MATKSSRLAQFSLLPFCWIRHLCFDTLWLHGRSLIPQALEQCCRQVTFSKGRNDGNNALSLVFWALGHLSGSQDGSSGTDSTKDSFFCGHVAGHLHGILATDLNDFVQQTGVGVSGDETSTDSLDLVRTGLSSAQDCRLNGFDRDNLQRWVQRLEVLSASSEGSSSSNSSDENVDLQQQWTNNVSFFCCALTTQTQHEQKRFRFPFFTFPSVSSQISGPVVSRWIFGLSGLLNCCNKNPSCVVAISSALAMAPVVMKVKHVWGKKYSERKQQHTAQFKKIWASQLSN